MRALIAAALALMSTTTLAQTRPPIDQRTEADYAPRPYTTVQNAPWMKDAVIYQLNTRQFSKEGTFRAAQTQLPRLKKLGVDVIWLMPIHPIGAKNRKGTLGSPYSVRDYMAVNPEFGTKADLKAFVDAAHAQGLHVILDWVANHTAWDNAWVTQHPDWYKRDWAGNFHPTPWWDWSDIIDLDYSKPGLRKAMTEAMAYWVRDFGIDGYRADVAGYVPLDFWEGVRADLQAIRPVFMLAEWKTPDLLMRAFDATYSWQWYETMEGLYEGKANATSLYGYYSENEKGWPKAGMRLLWIENHDINSWHKTEFEAFGDMLPAAITLEMISEGLPMIYNGQEACNPKRLEFFEKDAIDWSKPCALNDLYRDLIAFRKSHPALGNGKWGATMVKVENDKPAQVFSFVRAAGKDKVFAAFNFSKAPVTVTFPTTLQAGSYREFRTGARTVVKAGTTMVLPAWGSTVLATQ
ncbi:alpha-amylase family glycosyl hydrolase [Sphingomonas sp. GB1N7]|uniref:alpha-amylase family glycosyl hydrolase n=1 Tax=Parasphingomonas caseinilytica TaxID=3096158 RepID=UPI002FC9EB73